MIKKTLELNWKPFSISLDKLEAWCRANLPSYVGNSADVSLRLHFSEDDAEEQAMAQAQWDSIDENHDFAKSYVPAGEIASLIEKAKADAVTKSWDQLSVAQKKLIMGQMPTLAELQG